MSPRTETGLVRMRQCQSDLALNGIDLAGAGKQAVRLLVRRHLDYFQLMLGYDAGPREIVALVERLSRRRQRGGSGRKKATSPA